VKGEFLTGFVAEVRDGLVVEVRWDEAGFHPAELFYFGELARDIAFVFDFDLELLGGGRGEAKAAEGFVEREEFCEGYFGAAEDFFEACAVAEG